MAKTDLTQQLKELQELAEKAGVIGQLRKLISQRNAAMAKVNDLDNKIDKLIGAPTGKKRGPKPGAKRAGRKAGKKTSMPTPGSAPYKLVEVMDPKKPMQREEIAKAVGLTVNTINQYLQKFSCFKNAGRGKGYICIKATPASASTQKKTKKKAAKKKTKKRTTKKKTVKK